MKLIKLTIYLEPTFDEDEIDDLSMDIEDHIEEFQGVDKVVCEIVEVEDNA